MGKPHGASALAELARFIADHSHGTLPAACTVPHSDRAPPRLRQRQRQRSRAASVASMLDRLRLHAAALPVAQRLSLRGAAQRGRHIGGDTAASTVQGWFGPMLCIVSRRASLANFRKLHAFWQAAGIGAQ